MATIALNRLTNRAVEVIRDGKAEYFTSVANTFISYNTGADGFDYINVVFKRVPAQNRTIQFKVADVTTINSVAKPTLTSDLAKLLATDIF